MLHEFTSNWLVPIILIIGFTILYFVFKSLLPSYFSEKGKNLATKDDIAEITGLVEQVKATFTEQNEKLKANLSILTSIQLGLVNEERNSIIEVNQTFFKWFNTISTAGLGDADTLNSNDIKEHLREIGRQYNTFTETEGKFMLFVEDKELRVKFHNLKIEVLTHMQPVLQDYAFELYERNNEYDAIKARQGQHYVASEYSPNFEKRDVLRKSVSSSILKAYTILEPIITDFQSTCRSYMRKLLETNE